MIVTFIICVTTLCALGMILKYKEYSKMRSLGYTLVIETCSTCNGTVDVYDHGDINGCPDCTNGLISTWVKND